MKRAVYAGSFDPPTNGHLWMINEASELFDELVLAIGINPEKHCTFSIEERQTMLEDICQGMSNVTVASFGKQFLVNYAVEIDANYIVRGIRSAADYEYERIMRHINSDLHSDISTVFLMPPREFAELSSTMVKGLIGPEGWQSMVRRYLPDPVYQRIVSSYPR